MNKKTSIAFIAASLIATTSAFAWYGEATEKEGREHKAEQRMKGGKQRADMAGKVAKHMDREFSADEVRTLSEARLIMKGNPNVRVDEVKPTDAGYSVTIVTQDNSLVKELNLAKNGMPLERYEALQKHMEMRQNGERRAKRSERAERGERGERTERREKAGKRGQKGKRGNIGHRMMEREYTADQIETLTKAKLIMRGNPNLKLGTVTPTDTGYSVTIVTQDNSLFEEQELAKNGMHLKKYEQIQKRMEMRQQRQSAQ